MTYGGGTGCDTSKARASADLPCCGSFGNAWVERHMKNLKGFLNDTVRVLDFFFFFVKRSTNPATQTNPQVLEKGLLNKKAIMCRASRSNRAKPRVMHRCRDAAQNRRASFQVFQE